MNDFATLTKDERECLKRWFRQAIAKVEQDEVTAQFIQTHGISTEENHRTPLVRRRTRRNRVFAHAMRQLV